MKDKDEGDCRGPSSCRKQYSINLHLRYHNKIFLCVKYYIIHIYSKMFKTCNIIWFWCGNTDGIGRAERKAQNHINSAYSSYVLWSCYVRRSHEFEWYFWLLVTSCACCWWDLCYPTQNLPDLFSYWHNACCIFLMPAQQHICVSYVCLLCMVLRGLYPYHVSILTQLCVCSCTIHWVVHRRRQHDLKSFYSCRSSQDHQFTHYSIFHFSFRISQ